MKKPNFFNTDSKIVPNIINMDSVEISRLKARSIAGTIEYVPNSVVRKTIIRRPTGNICVMSFDTGKGIKGKILPFDSFVQIIDGKAEILIGGISHCVQAGQGIIIPAYLANAFTANERFKMMLTTIKPAVTRKTP